LGFVIVSVSGLKAIVPAIAIAVTISGEATKAWVLDSPSFRFAKFLLNEVMIVFFRFGSSICLAHCPIQGPQALARHYTAHPSTPDKSISLNCVTHYSEPGVMVNSEFALSPLETASLTILALC
jgi:hypothetical protein